MSVASSFDFGQELQIVQLCRSMDRLSEEALAAVEADPATPAVKEAARRQRLYRSEVRVGGDDDRA
jgi:hypothetical protein